MQPKYRFIVLRNVWCLHLWWIYIERVTYRIYSINCPERLLNFCTLRVGAYSRWALIRGWALIKFSLFSASVVCLFCNKSKKGNNKTRRCKQVPVKYSEENSVFGEFSYSGLVLIHFCWVGGGKWGWVLVVGGYLSLSGRKRRWVIINFFCL